MILILPFRAQWGDAWSYAHLGWGGILGAQFGMQAGVKLALASTLAGLLLILPLVWYRFQRQSISPSLLRAAFYLGSTALVITAILLKFVD